MTNIYINTNSTNSDDKNILNIFVREDENRYAATRAMSEDEIICAAKEILSNRLKRKASIHNAQDCRDFLVAHLGGYEHEVFCVIFLDNQQGVIAIDEVFRGTITQSPIYPREIAKQALKYNAARVILAHNHPSGNIAASYGDIEATEKVSDALKMIDVIVVDHVIVGGGSFLSFAKEGII